MFLVWSWWLYHLQVVQIHTTNPQICVYSVQFMVGSTCYSAHTPMCNLSPWQGLQQTNLSFPAITWDDNQTSGSGSWLTTTGIRSEASQPPLFSLIKHFKTGVIFGGHWQINTYGNPSTIKAGVAFWYRPRSQIVPISSAHARYKVLEFGFPSRSEIVPNHSRLPLFLLLFLCFHRPAPFLV